MNEELLNEFSSILKEKNIDINDLLSSMNSTNNSSENNDNNKSNFEKKENNTSNSSIPDSLDISTILKLKTIFEKYKSNDSKNVQLLMALKPFMKESRKAKIDQYAKMLKFAEILENIDLFGGDKL